MEESTKITRAAFLGALGGLALVAIISKLGSFLDFSQSARLQSAASAASYGNSPYGGTKK